MLYLATQPPRGFPNWSLIKLNQKAPGSSVSECWKTKRGLIVLQKLTTDIKIYPWKQKGHVREYYSFSFFKKNSHIYLSKTETQNQPNFLDFIMPFAYATCSYKKSYLGKVTASIRTIYLVISCIPSPCKTGALYYESSGTGLTGIYKIL